MFYENFVKLTKEKYHLANEKLFSNSVCVGGALIRFLEPTNLICFPDLGTLTWRIEKHFLGITFDAATKYARQIIILNDKERFDEAFNVVEQLSKEFPVTI